MFTSSCPERNAALGQDSNDIDRHVSLEVDVEEEGSEDDDVGNDIQLPRLYTKRWVQGLCFFRGCRREEVLFPWPAPLVRIAPEDWSDSDSSV